MSLSYGGVEPQPSLAWTFESSNVDIVTGLTPSAQVSPGPAQLQGSAALVTNAPTSNTAVRFPGVSGSYMNLGTSSPTNFNHSTSNIFVESWVNVNSFSTNPQVYVRYTAVLFTDFNFYFAPDGSMQVTMKDGTTGTNYTASNTFAMSTGVWYHVAFSYETINKNVTVFVNGYPGTAVTLPNPPRYTSAIPITIGGNDISNSHNLYISDLRVVQGGVVPVATFTPGAAPFSYASPGYVPSMGTTVFTLLGQFITYNPSGKYGSSLLMGGQCNLRYNYPSAIPLDTGGATISMWLKPLSLPAAGVNAWLFGSYGTGNGDRIYAFLYSDGGIWVYFRSTGGDVGFRATGPALGTWCHLAFVLGSNNGTLYLNGNTVNSQSCGMTGLSLDTRFGLATLSGGNSPYINAEYDDFRIYNTALTATQVQSVYSSQGAPAPSRAMPLPKLAWDFNGTTTDYVSGLAPTTTTGTPTYPTGKYRTAISFPNVSRGGGSNAATNTLYFSTTPIPSSNSYIGLTIALWVNTTQLPYPSDQSYILLWGDNAIVHQNGTIQTFTYNPTAGNYPGVVYNFTPTLGTWYHYCVVFNNGTVTQYVNGAQTGTNSVPNARTLANPALAIGSDGTNRPFYGLTDDLRIFDRALTSAQVQSIYNQQGVPGRGASGLSLPLDKVSGQVSGAYSTRLIRSAYTGPVVRVRRNSDSTQLDFISDVTGNLSNVSSAVSIASWLSATTGNVSTWYDQSGGSNNFTQSITSQQPQIVQNGGKWVVWFNRDATPTFYSNLSCATAMTGIKTIVYNFNTIYNAYQTILGAEQSDNTGFRFNSNKIIGDATGGRLGQDFLAAAGSYWYLNGDYGYMISNDGTTGVPSGNYIYNDLAWNHVVGVQNGGGMDGFGFNAISSPQLPIKSRAMNGYMSEIILFRNQLSAADSLYLYNSRYISRGSQIALTGTPLFSQLSSAATSSAVGAFSLRAVNGTSARAVQVRRVPSTAGTSAIQFSIIGNQFSQADASPAPPDTSVAGQVTYNGTSQYTRINSLSLTPTTTGATVSLNFKLNSTASGQYILKMFSSTQAYAVQFYYNGTNIVFNITSNGTTYYPTAYAATSGVNYYIVLIFTGTNVYTYINNVLWSTTTIGQALVNDTSYTLWGLGSYNGGGYTSMTVYDFRIMNTVLTASDIVATDFYADRLGNLLTAPVTGQSLANWLGGATGYVTTWYDQSGAGNHVSQTVAARQPSITTNGTIVFSGAQSFSNAATTGGCLAASAGTGTKYSYGAVWNPSILSGYQTICEHNASTGTTSKRSSLLLNTAALGFNGQNNDIQALIGGLVTGTQYSTIARIDNTTAGYTANGNKNVRMRQNGVDYSGLTTDYTTLNLDNYQFVIGKKATTSGEFFSGSMKSIMVFKDALSDADTALLHAWQQSI